MHLLKILWLILACDHAIACRALEALAHHTGKERADRFVQIYEAAIAQIEATKELTPNERASLAQDPLKFPDLESGRTEIRRLFGELGRAFASVDEALRSGVQDRLKGIVAVQTTSEREATRETNRSTKRPLARPEVQVEAKYFHSFDLLAGGREIFSIGGTQVIESEPGRLFEMPPKIVNHFMHPDQEWVLAHANDGGYSWMPTNSKKTPTTPPPFPIEAIAPTDGKPFGPLFFASDKKNLAVERDGDLFFFRSGEGYSLMPGFRRASLFGFSPNAKKLWLSRPDGITTWGTAVMIYDVETRKETPSFLNFRQGRFAAGLTEDTVQVVGTLSQAPPYAFYFWELDALSGQIRHVVPLPDLEFGSAALLAKQPVLLAVKSKGNPQTGPFSFETFLISKDTGKVLARGRSPGRVRQIVASPDGSKIAITHDTRSNPDQDMHFRLEVYDLADWLREGTAANPR